MSTLETPRFPDMLALNITCGPEFSTRVAAMRSGFEQRNANWSLPKWTADAASAIRTMDDLQTIEDFFYAMGGQLHSFRIKDYSDYQAGSRGKLIPLGYGGQTVGNAGAGYGVGTLQLGKQYSAGSFAQNRWILKPVSGTVTLFRGATPVTIGAGAGEASINYTNGRVTFVEDQTRTISSHTPQIPHLITLSSALSPNIVVGNRVWLTGVTGTAAQFLNNIPLEVTNVAGATIAVSLASNGLTASGGTLHLYPQSSEALTWTGEFDICVRFAIDKLNKNLLLKSNNRVVAQVTSIPLVEDRNVVFA